MRNLVCYQDILYSWDINRVYKLCVCVCVCVRVCIYKHLQPWTISVKLLYNRGHMPTVDVHDIRDPPFGSKSHIGMHIKRNVQLWTWVVGVGGSPWLDS